ncbi:MAG: hypothetical protein PHD83_02325 [Caldisericia bacterium]|nr:hypothetical protein [Caldisericia bacterium]
MVNNENPISTIAKGVSLGVLLMLVWFLGVRQSTKTVSSSLEKVTEETILIDGSLKNMQKMMESTTFSIPLGNQEHQIGFMPYQEKVPPGWAQGALPTELYRNSSQITWIGDPYGPRLTGWNQEGKLETSFALPFLRNEAAPDKEIVGYTLTPSGDNGWFVLNNQNKKIYQLDGNGHIIQILSIPLMLSDQRIILTISPFFEVINNQWIFVTLESTKQPFSTLKGFAGGTYLETNWESYFLSSSGEVVGPLPEQTAILPFQGGLISWTYESEALTLQWSSDPHSLSHPQKTWIVRNPVWHYGGMIGTDLENNIYFWADQSIIGCIQTRFNEVRYMELPAEKKMFPVTISPDGEIGYIIANKQFLQVHFMKMMD